MDIWVVLFSDCFESNDVFYAAFLTEKEARDCCDDLMLKRYPETGEGDNGGWDYLRVTLGEKP